MVAQVVETSDDVDPDRKIDLARRFQEAGDYDAIVLELPQLWVIPDPEFSARTASIGLYPRSYWMGFFTCWGKVTQAEIFFRTVERKCDEPMVHVVVQYHDPSCMKMCFTFLHDRYLAHPKLELGVRPSRCRLIMCQDFKAKAAVKSKAVKAAARSGAGAKAKPKAGPKPAVAKKAPKSAALRQLAPATPGSAASAASAAAAAAGQGKQMSAPMTPLLAPMTPFPKQRGNRQGPPLPDTPQTPVDRALTPAEAMHGLSGRQLEAFQMVMSRMERLEKENQELMQILLQMQALLQQQQQRNARLTQAAGFQASGHDQDQHLPPQLGVTAPPLLTASLPQPVPLPAAPLLSGTMPGSSPLASAPFPPLPVPGLGPPPPHLSMQVSSPPLPSGGGASASNAPVAESISGVRVDKRKAEVLGQTPVTPGAGAEEVVDTGAPAPWKSQRKRQKRPRGEAGAEGGEGSVGTAGQPLQPAPARRAPPPAPPVPQAPGSPVLAPPSPASAAKSRPGVLRKPGQPQGASLAAYNQALLGV